MKKITLVLSIVLIGFAAQSQYVFNKDGFALNAGLGLFSYGGMIPSINLSGEMGILPTGDVGLLSVGGIVAYKYSRHNYSFGYDSYSYNYHQFVIGPRVIWHLHTFESDKWDAYAGAGSGIRLWSDYYYNDNYEDGNKESHVSFYGEAFVGGRMMLKSGFGLFAEVGYGTLSSAKFGLTFMLK